MFGTTLVLSFSEKVRSIVRECDRSKLSEEETARALVRILFDTSLSIANFQKTQLGKLLAVRQFYFY